MQPKNYQFTIINNFGNDYLEEHSTNDLRYKCPHCRELGKTYNDYKLYVSYRTLSFHCFRCGWKGKLSSDEFVEEGTTDKFLQMLTTFKKKHIVDENEDDEESPVVFKIPMTVPHPDHFAVTYLNSRGISYEDVLHYNMRVASDADAFRFQGRIVIPNKVIANQWTDMYSARAFINVEPKYLNPKNSPRAKTVFNLHNIQQDCDQIIINEGVLTSIAAGTDSVATYGKSVTDEQIRQIAEKRPKRIYVSLDNDANPDQLLFKDPTRYKVDELIQKLLTMSKAEIYLVKMPPGKDAVDLGREVYRSRYISNAIRIKDIREYQLYSGTI